MQSVVLGVINASLGVSWIVAGILIKKKPGWSMKLVVFLASTVVAHIVLVVAVWFLFNEPHVIRRQIYIVQDTVVVWGVLGVICVIAWGLLRQQR